MANGLERTVLGGEQTRNKWSGGEQSVANGLERTVFREDVNRPWANGQGANSLWRTV